MPEPKPPSEPQQLDLTEAKAADPDADPVHSDGATGRQRTFAFERDVPEQRTGGQPS
jgi:hypothetical protein